MQGGEGGGAQEFAGDDVVALAQGAGEREGIFAAAFARRRAAAAIKVSVTLGHAR